MISTPSYDHTNPRTTHGHDGFALIPSPRPPRAEPSEKTHSTGSEKRLSALHASHSRTSTFIRTCSCSVLLRVQSPTPRLRTSGAEQPPAPANHSAEAAGYRGSAPPCSWNRSRWWTVGKRRMDAGFMCLTGAERLRSMSHGKLRMRREQEVSYNRTIYGAGCPRQGTQYRASVNANPHSPSFTSSSTRLAPSRDM